MIEMEKKQNNSLFADVKWLLLKILLLGIIFAVVWIFLLGICRNGDESMNPAIRAGDLVIYDRLTQEYHTGDVVVIKQDGGRQIRRVAAVSGDVVDVTEEGLNVNGYQQQEAISIQRHYRIRMELSTLNSRGRSDIRVGR